MLKTEACSASGVTDGVTTLRAATVTLGPHVHARLCVARVLVTLAFGSVTSSKDKTTDRSETLFTQAIPFHLICHWKQVVIGHSARTLRVNFANMLRSGELSWVAD